jgi:hypothetical protein
VAQDTADLDERHAMIAPLVLALAVGVQAPQRAAAAPAVENAKPIIDNARVTVWDLAWTSAPPAVLTRDTGDTVWVSVTPSPGQVVYFKKGEPRRLPSRNASSSRMIVIELKDHPVAPLANTTGLPNAFPRAGNTKAFENDRLVVWDYTWTPGQPTPMHFHDKDVVVVYLKDGALRSTTHDGTATTNQVSTGLTRFNARNRAHSETLVQGESRAVIVELK